jgi:hypothetical protein
MITAFYVSNIIMRIILISVFICIFFFTYGVYLQKEIIKSQVEYLINDLLNPIKVFLPKSEKIKKQIRELDIKINESEDEKVRQKNNVTKVKAFLAIFILVTIGIIAILAISKLMNRENMTHKQFWFKLFKYNIILLFFIGMTKFIFASFYVKNYIFINTNILKKSVIDNVINYFEKDDEKLK